MSERSWKIQLRSLHFNSTELNSKKKNKTTKSRISKIVDP